MKQIDRTKSLSTEDALYLSNRGLLTAAEEEKYGIKPVPNGGTLPEPGEEIGDVGTADSTPIVGGLSSEQAAAQAAGSESEEVPPYEQWSKKDLKSEAAARDLPVGGTVGDLADRLNAFDAFDAAQAAEEAASEEEEEEDDSTPPES